MERLLQEKWRQRVQRWGLTAGESDFTLTLSTQTQLGSRACTTPEHSPTLINFPLSLLSSKWPPTPHTCTYISLLTSLLNASLRERERERERERDRACYWMEHLIFPMLNLQISLPSTKGQPHLAIQSFLSIIILSLSTRGTSPQHTIMLWYFPTFNKQNLQWPRIALQFPLCFQTNFLRLTSQKRIENR